MAPEEKTEKQKHRVKVDAGEALADIKEGYTDLELMEKHNLSAKGLQSLFRKLQDAKLLKQSDLTNRPHYTERTVDLEVYRCPACNMPQFFAFDECPQCGVIVSKLKKQKKGAKTQTAQVTRTINVGPRTITASQDGTSLSINGLNRQLQNELIDVINTVLTRSHS
jgi:hypothetical protein